MKLTLSAPRTTIVLAGLVVVIAGVAWALFDWNWLRGPVERYFADRSGREVRIGHLHVELGLTHGPIVRLRDVFIENAHWASKKPMAVVGEVQFTFSPSSLWERRRVITRVVLKDADVVLERRADGLRNWRLSHPDRAGPGRYRIHALEPHRSQIRFTHEGIDFDVVAAASPLEPGSEGKHSPALTNRITFKGSYQGAAFSGAALTGEVVSFRDSDESFPIRGHIASGGARLEIDGTMADFLRLSAMDAGVRLAGPSLSRLHPFVAFRPPATRPFEAQGRVRFARDEYTVSDLLGKLGSTQFAGEGSYTRASERPLLRAALRSDAADLSDLLSFLNIDDAPRAGPSPGVRRSGSQPPIPREAPSPATRAATGGKDRAQTGGKDRAQTGGKDHAQTGGKDHAHKLKAIDAHVTLDARKMTAAAIPALEGVKVSVTLVDGLLQLDPLDFGLAGGRVTGTLTVDGRNSPLRSDVALIARNIRLERLLPKARLNAPMRARVKLSGRGESFAAILDNATGSVVAIADRGSVSNLADAKLALNPARILGLLIRGDSQIAVNCGAIAFDFENGTGKSSVVLLDTEDSRVAGHGTLVLRSREYELTLTPETKERALLAQHKSIRMRGTLGDAKVNLVDRVRVEPMKKAPPALGELLRASSNNGERAGGCAEALATGSDTASQAQRPR